MSGKREYTDEELRGLKHNDHEAAFNGYLSQSRHTRDKQGFLFEWLDPRPTDYILECGSSSGKTSIDLARRAGCRCVGVDFDEAAVRISSEMRDRHFPELASLCQFIVGDLATMQFDRGFNKILMPDFTEHIPDRVLLPILKNIRSQFGDVQLYVYTPSRHHVFEMLKHRNLVLRNSPGHINVKTPEQLSAALNEAGWRITDLSWRYSSMPYVKAFEIPLARLPLVGKHFRRRIVIKARPA